VDNGRRPVSRVAQGAERGGVREGVEEVSHTLPAGRGVWKGNLTSKLSIFVLYLRWI